MALVCRKTCGETRFFCNDAHACAAVFTCFWRMYSNPERVIGRPWALTNSSRALFAPLAEHTYAGRRVEVQGLEREADQLRHPQPRGKTQMEHCSVTDAVAPLQIWHIQEALHLLDCEIMHQPGLGF